MKGMKMKLLKPKSSCGIKKRNKKNLLLSILTCLCFFGSACAFASSTAVPNPLSAPDQSFLDQSSLKSNKALKPSEALKRLIEGNKRFTQDKVTCPERQQVRREATAASQRPFAIVLGCSDSRVPPEIAFDQGIGDVFVVRVAGNIVSAIELNSVEYSAIHNNSSIVVVLGHENCGAVTAVLENKTQDIESIADIIRRGLARFNPKVNPQNQMLNLQSAIEVNIKNSVMLIKQSPYIDKLIRAGKLMVVGAYYDLKTGAVRILDTETNP